MKNLFAKTLLLLTLFFFGTRLGAEDCDGNVEIQKRREAVLEALGEPGDAPSVALLLRSPAPSVYSNDIEYPYRPDNNLYYLSGIAEEGTVLLLSNRPIGEHGKAVLFLKPVEEWYGQWIGKRLTSADAARKSGIAETDILWAPKLEETLRELFGLGGGGQVHGHRHPAVDQESPVFYLEAGASFAPGENPSPAYGFLLKTFGSDAFRLELRSPGTLIHPLRQIKSSCEIELIQSAIDATCEAHKNAMELVRVGLHEYDLGAEIESTFRREGCSGWAFPSIIGSGPNSCVLHYMSYDRQLANGDVVVMDIGAECGYYAADITRTVPVSGRFTERQRVIYDLVLAAQAASMKLIRPGVLVQEVHEKSREVIAKGLVELGLIKEESEVDRYFPHGTSHGLGLDVHDPMPVKKLEPGMVITVEPGIYIPEENLGIRIEDDVLVTREGYRILSGRLPRKADEIERLMRSKSL